MDSSNTFRDESQNPHNDRSQMRSESDGRNVRDGGKQGQQHRGYQIQTTHHSNTYGSTSSAKRFRRG